MQIDFILDEIRVHTFLVLEVELDHIGLEPQEAEIYYIQCEYQHLQLRLQEEYR